MSPKGLFFIRAVIWQIWPDNRHRLVAPHPIGTRADIAVVLHSTYRNTSK